MEILFTKRYLPSQCKSKFKSKIFFYTCWNELKRLTYRIFQFLNNERLYLKNKNLRILMIPNDPQLKFMMIPSDQNKWVCITFNYASRLPHFGEHCESDTNIISAKIYFDSNSYAYFQNSRQNVIKLTYFLVFSSLSSLVIVKTFMRI